MPAETENAERFVESYRRAWESWDIEGFIGLFSEDVVYVAHPDEVVNGLDELRRYLEKEKEAQGAVEVEMGLLSMETDRVIAEFWVYAESASIAGCLMARLDERGISRRFREYWFDLDGRRAPFEGWGE